MNTLIGVGVGAVLGIVLAFVFHGGLWLVNEICLWFSEQWSGRARR
jgi:hypothetical protein